MLGVPAAAHLHVVLGLHPEGVDLRQTHGVGLSALDVKGGERSERTSHQRRSELLLQQGDEGQAVGALLGRQVVVGVVLLENTKL